MLSYNTFLIYFQLIIHISLFDELKIVFRLVFEFRVSVGLMELMVKVIGRSRVGLRMFGSGVCRVVAVFEVGLCCEAGLKFIGLILMLMILLLLLLLTDCEFLLHFLLFHIRIF